ncbi:hypothetical protein [Acetobacterium bakii]|nr:hypothetical protein [Acetobacterium bakii]
MANIQKLDNLLKIAKQIKAKEVLSKAFGGFGEEPSFIEALGLNPEDYIAPYPNSDHGYDDMQALRDGVADAWDDYEVEGF